MIKRGNLTVQIKRQAIVKYSANVLQSYRNTSDQDYGVQARPRAQCTAVSVQDGGVFERGPKVCRFSTLPFMFSRSILMLLSFLYLFTVMSNLTVEKLEEILEEKLRKVILPLSKQIEDAYNSPPSWPD